MKPQVTLLGLALGACTTMGPVGEPGHTLDDETVKAAIFQIRVIPGSPEKSLVTVEISVPSSVTRFTAPTAYGGAPVFLRYLSEIKAVDRAGASLPLDVRGNEVLVTPGPGLLYTLSYVYNVPQQQPGEIDQALPTLDARHATFDHNLTFLNPEGIGDMPAHLAVFFPSEWAIATSWGRGHKFEVPRISALIAGITVAGDYRFTSAEIGSTRVDLAVRGGLDDGILKDQFLRVMGSQQAIAGELPSHYLLAVFQPFHPSVMACAGTSLTNAIVVNVPVDEKLEPFNFTVIGTASHELFHQWNLRSLRPLSEDGVYLFTEGFTNYFAVAALVRANLVPEAKFADFLGKYRLKLEGNARYPGTGFPEIQRGFADNDGDLIALAYTKGPFVAVLLDLALRADTEGSQSISSWFRTLLAQFGEKKGYTVHDLRASLVKITGDPSGQAVSVFDEAFLGRSALNLSALFERLGIEQRGPREFALLHRPENVEALRSKVFSAR